MENNFKIRIDEIVEDLGKIQDLNIKIDILNYMEQQAAFLLWQLDEEKRIDENMRNVLNHQRRATVTTFRYRITLPDRLQYSNSST